MLSAYLDESGIHEGADICVVSGYFGGENQWKKFDHHWTKILRDYGVPELHSKQFWGRDKKGKRIGPYKDWDDAKAEKFLSKLVSVIEQATAYPIASLVVVHDFLSFSYDERRFLTGGGYLNGKFVSSGAPSKPYFVPFQHCILESVKYCKPGIKMNYYFDFNKVLSGYAQDLYKIIVGWIQLTRDPAGRALGEIGFPTGIQAPALQAADLLAYQTYQYRKTGTGERRHAMPHLLRQLLSKSKDNRDFVFYDRKTLILSLEDCPPSIRATF